MTRDGSDSASGDFIEEVYGTLRRMADAKLARLPPGASIQATGLVHDVYLRLKSRHDSQWANRRDFFSAAAVAMRDLMVERARAKATLRRGGNLRRMPEEAVAELSASAPSNDGVIELTEALEELEQAHPRKAELVLLRYFSGLSAADTAELLGVSISTVDRDWRFARAWLHDRLAGDPER